MGTGGSLPGVKADGAWCLGKHRNNFILTLPIRTNAEKES